MVVVKDCVSGFPHLRTHKLVVYFGIVCAGVVLLRAKVRLEAGWRDQWPLYKVCPIPTHHHTLDCRLHLRLQNASQIARNITDCRLQNVYLIRYKGGPYSSKRMTLVYFAHLFQECAQH